MVMEWSVFQMLLYYLVNVQIQLVLTVSCDGTNIVSQPGGSDVKNFPAMQDIQVWSLGWEDPLQKEMTTHWVAWEIS